MIIKGLFKRYERWNPVHPTTGAFWGMGIGIGCGVGWGPGFGPDVVGYVGAGCGVGFSVGITFVGIGIGLPANTHVKAPYNAFVATRSTVLEFVRSNGLISMKNVTEDWWKYILQKSALQQGPSGSIACFENKHSLVERFNFSEMRSQMSCNTRSMLERLGAFKDGCFKPNKGST